MTAALHLNAYNGFQNEADSENMKFSSNKSRQHTLLGVSEVRVCALISS